VLTSIDAAGLALTVKVDVKEVFHDAVDLVEPTDGLARWPQHPSLHHRDYRGVCADFDSNVRVSPARHAPMA